MFDKMRGTQILSPNTREDATKLISAGYGLQLFKSPWAGEYRTWVICSDGNGGAELNYAHGEQFAPPTIGYTIDEALDRAELLAPLPNWEVVESA